MNEKVEGVTYELTILGEQSSSRLTDTSASRGNETKERRQVFARFGTADKRALSAISKLRGELQSHFHESTSQNVDRARQIQGF